MDIITKGISIYKLNIEWKKTNGLGEKDAQGEQGQEGGGQGPSGRRMRGGPTEDGVPLDLGPSDMHHHALDRHLTRPLTSPMWLPHPHSHTHSLARRWLESRGRGRKGGREGVGGHGFEGSTLHFWSLRSLFLSL